MKKIKILYIATAFARKKDDSVTPWLTKTVELLNEEDNLELEVLTSSFKGLGSHMLGNLMVHRFRYFFSPFETLTHEKCVPEKLKENKYMWFLIPFYMLSGIITTTWLIVKNRYHIVHIHWPFPHFFFIIPAKFLFNFRVISTFHGTGPKWVKHNVPFLNPLLKIVIRYSDLITVNSTYTRDRIVGKIGKSDTEIVPFGTSVDRETIKHPTEPGKILFVGRLVGRKGVRYLIEAISKVKEDFPEVKLTIVGGGPEEKKLKNQIAELDLIDTVEMTGHLSPEELVYHYQSCSIFVLPSTVNEIENTETLGVVLIEALTYEKPVIASEVGGIVDIVKHRKTGLLVEEKNSEMLTDAIKELLGNPSYSEKLGKRGYEHIKKYFSWKQIIRKLKDIYSRVTDYRH